jgi:hypothetical protein
MIDTAPAVNDLGYSVDRHFSMTSMKHLRHIQFQLTLANFGSI